MIQRANQVLQGQDRAKGRLRARNWRLTHLATTHVERERDPLDREQAQQRSSRESRPHEGDRQEEHEREWDTVDSPSRPTRESSAGRLHQAPVDPPSRPTHKFDGWKTPPVGVSEHKGLL